MSQDVFQQAGSNSARVQGWAGLPFQRAGQELLHELKIRSQVPFKTHSQKKFWLTCSP